MKNGFYYIKNGWKYISIKGNAYERGYAYGYIIAKDFKKIQEMLIFTSMHDYGHSWKYFIKHSMTSSYLLSNQVRVNASLVACIPS